jgi:chromosome segregation ATPase
MANPASRDLIFGLRNRNERLQQIQALTHEVENNVREIVEIDSKINSAENKIKTAENIIVAHERVIKDTEALITNNEKIIKTTEELLSCYKALLANNESQKNSSTVNSNTLPSTEERVISMTAYEKAKQDLVDLNLDLKTNKHLVKVVEKRSSVTTNQSVDDSKTRMTAYNILNDCFNKFRLNYLFSKRWF